MKGPQDWIITNEPARYHAKAEDSKLGISVIWHIHLLDRIGRYNAQCSRVQIPIHNIWSAKNEENGPVVNGFFVLEPYGLREDG